MYVLQCVVLLSPENNTYLNDTRNTVVSLALTNTNRKVSYRGLVTVPFYGLWIS